LNFQDGDVTFKMCDGYMISHSDYHDDTIHYSVYLNGKLVIDGYSSNYQLYIINHEIADDLVESNALQKVKK